MIKIISGWSAQGGSTVAFINLTNALNEVGHDAVFCGPQTWHLNKCKSEQYVPGKKATVSPDDTLIIHFNNKFTQRPPVRGFFLSSHEQNIFPLQNIKYDIFDGIHYVSEHQRLYHQIQHPYFVIPNILNDLKPNKKPSGKIGGIIGSIDANKNVDVAIQNALDDGCDKVLIYGMISDPWTWQKSVQPLVDGKRVVYVGFEDNKQKIYDSVTDVYHSSTLETWGYIKGECKLTETNFHGNNSTDGYWEMSKEEIVNRWVEELEVPTKEVDGG